jgi:hypothetical protein
MSASLAEVRAALAYQEAQMGQLRADGASEESSLALLKEALLKGTHSAAALDQVATRLDNLQVTLPNPWTRWPRAWTTFR